MVFDGVDGFNLQNLASGQPFLGSLFSSRYSASVEPLATCSSAAHIRLRRLSVDLQHFDNQSHFLAGLAGFCGDYNSTPTGWSED
jgi:hypothetical protein